MAARDQAAVEVIMWRAAVILVALTCPALAQQRFLPPAEYDHPYSGRLVKFRKNSVEDVRTTCKTPLAMGLGCAWLPSEGVCIIIMANDEVIAGAGHDPEVVLRHETAHCNGWPKDHLGARK